MYDRDNKDKTGVTRISKTGIARISKTGVTKKRQG